MPRRSRFAFTGGRKAGIIAKKVGEAIETVYGCGQPPPQTEKIIGQLGAIDKMVDQDVPCEDMLMQINAAKSALHKVGQVVLEGHLNHCVRDGIEHGDADRTIAEFAKAIEHFSRMS